MKPIHKKIKQLRINKMRNLINGSMNLDRDYVSLRVFIPSLNEIRVHRLKICISAKKRRIAINELHSLNDNALLKYWSQFKKFINNTKRSKGRTRGRLLPFAVVNFKKV